MFNLNFSQKTDSPCKILCLLLWWYRNYCGATILRLVENYSNIEFYWVVLVQTRKEKKKKSANLFLKKAKQKKHFL